MVWFAADLRQPIMEAIRTFVSTFDAHNPPIMRDYPHLPLVVLPLYVLFVFVGPMVMKGRKLSFFDVTLKWWNLALSVLSGICCVYWTYLVRLLAGWWR